VIFVAVLESKPVWVHGVAELLHEFFYEHVAVRHGVTLWETDRDPVIRYRATHIGMVATMVCTKGEMVVDLVRHAPCSMYACYRHGFLVVRPNVHPTSIFNSVVGAHIASGVRPLNTTLKSNPSCGGVLAIDAAGH
tara:strand:+ start:2660 stop:3067 length:408 start_codon:yes stop_codon:yes gene_type:complete